MCLLKATRNKLDLKGILDLQSQNLPENISLEEKTVQGFVTVHHDLDQLMQMASYEPQMVAIDQSSVVGYVLSMVADMRDEFPEIAPMFDMLPYIMYKEKLLSQYAYIVCGQTCVAKEYRGKGIVRELYEKMKSTFYPKYTLCITEVARSNTRSLKAHNKVGFETVHVYNDGKEDWELVVWDWEK